MDELEKKMDSLSLGYTYYYVIGNGDQEEIHQNEEDFDRVIDQFRSFGCEIGLYVNSGIVIGKKIVQLDAIDYDDWLANFCDITRQHNNNQPLYDGYYYYNIFVRFNCLSCGTKMENQEELLNYVHFVCNDVYNCNECSECNLNRNRFICDACIAGIAGRAC